MKSEIYEPITLAAVGPENTAELVLLTVCILFMFWRHSENIRRLCTGKEPKFTIRK